jgi:hypothetical protein
MARSVRKNAARFAVRREADRAEANIRRFYELGQQVCQKQEELERKGFPSSITAAAAEVYGSDRKPDHAESAARFADVVSHGELTEICALCHQPGYRPITIMHIRAILGVPDRTRRLKLLKRAAREHLTWVAFTRLIRGRTARPEPRQGRRFARPADLFETLASLETGTGKWLRQYRAVWSQDVFWSPEGHDSGKEAQLDRMRSRADQQLNELVESGTQLLQRLKKLKKKRGGMAKRNRAIT